MCPTKFFLGEQLEITHMPWWAASETFLAQEDLAIALGWHGHGIRERQA